LIEDLLQKRDDEGENTGEFETATEQVMFFFVLVHNDFFFFYVFVVESNDE
jgi:hypothetical protein